MNLLARTFFSAKGSFEEVRFLCEEKEFSWEEAKRMQTDLPRGWFELSRLELEDRIEFTKEFWLGALSFEPKAHAFLVDFFTQLSGLDLVLVREKGGDVFEAVMVYSVGDNSTFFRGKAPATERDVEELEMEIGVVLPRDYKVFMQMHNGFGKLSDLGILPLDEVPSARRKVMDLLLKGTNLIKSGEKRVDVGSLIPFFEIDGLSSFQCFYHDWYPGSEVGNVFFSGIDETVSDLSDSHSWTENLAFPTFLKWLAYYVQGMNITP